MSADTFDLLQTHGMLRRPGLRIHRSSDARSWTSAYVSVQRELPFHGDFGAVDDQLIVLHKSGPTRIETFRGDRGKTRTVPAGGVHLYPGREAFRIGLLDPLETIHIYLRRRLLEDVAGDLVVGDPRLLYIPPRIASFDSTISGFASLFELAVEDGDTGTGLYSDHLAVGLANYLIRHHSTARLRPHVPSVTVEREAADTCKRAVDFMVANLDAKITLDNIVAAVGRSSSYINNAFRDTHGISTHQYLMKLRLSEARYRIANSRDRITDIALECGFASQEHLARYFKKAYGITPRQARS